MMWVRDINWIAVVALLLLALGVVLSFIPGLGLPGVVVALAGIGGAVLALRG